jgi:hypothetical protein
MTGLKGERENCVTHLCMVTMVANMYPRGQVSLHHPIGCVLDVVVLCVSAFMEMAGLCFYMVNFFMQVVVLFSVIQSRLWI